MRKHRIQITSLLIALFVFASNGNSWGADTTEPFGLGASDVEFYLGFSGIGAKRNQRALASTVVLGFGILENLGVYYQVGFQANDVLSGAVAEQNIALFGTALDGKQFDLDWLVDIGLAEGQLAFLFMTELNYDSMPDMSGFGLYLRMGLKVFGESAILKESKLHFSIEAVPAAYYTFAPNHQVLLELDLAFSPEQQSFTVGGLSVGYNFVLNKTLELISEIHFDIPQESEPFSIRVGVGFVASL